MFEIIKEHDSPSSCFTMDGYTLPNIGKIVIEFFHPKWPDKERTGIEPGEFRTVKLEADIESAIKLRDELTYLIDKARVENIAILRGSLERIELMSNIRNAKAQCRATLDCSPNPAPAASEKKLK